MIVPGITAAASLLLLPITYDEGDIVVDDEDDVCSLAFLFWSSSLTDTLPVDDAVDPMKAAEEEGVKKGTAEGEELSTDVVLVDSIDEADVSMDISCCCCVENDADVMDVLLVSSPECCWEDVSMY